MRVTLKELLAKLGIPYVLEPYGNYPWSVSDSVGGSTCMAEVRMGPDSVDLEAEIFVIPDSPAPGKPESERIFWMQAKPQADAAWTPVQLRVRKEDYAASNLYDWQNKGCNLFLACVQEMMAGRIPDFDALIERELRGGERFAGGRGGGGKAPKIKPGSLLDMKKGGGF